jgi:3-oxoacyl-[acyl-carrier protein] reductase
MESDRMIEGEGRWQPLAGRVALVTGVSRRAGIGFAIARRLAQYGAELFLHSWSPFDAAQPWGADPDGAEMLAAELRDIGRRVEHQAADFRASEAPQQIMDATIAAFGHVDILIANHAYSTLGTLEELTTAEIDAHLEVNVRGTLLLIQAWARQHDDRRPGGRVVLMTSGQHRAPMPGELAYVASKGALHQLTVSLAAHLAPRQITVNTIDPGATDTGYATPALYEAVLRHEPQGRWGQPDDAARLIAWLATDEAQWVTGQVISSTGGGP